MTTTILSAKVLAAKIAEERKQKALAADKAHAAEQKANKLPTPTDPPKA